MGVPGALAFLALSVASPALADEPAARASTQEPRSLELRLDPLVAQLGASDVEHLGTGLAVFYSPSPGLAVGVSSRYHWRSRNIDQSASVPGWFRSWDVQHIEPPLAAGVVLAITEITMLRGELNVLGSGPFELSARVSGGAGAVWTRAQLKPASETTGPATFGDTGARIASSIGLSSGVKLGRGLSVHLALDLLLFGSRAQSVNGCSGADLDAMDLTLRAGESVSRAGVSAGCNLASFDGVDLATGLNRSNSVPIAKNLVFVPSSELARIATLSLGASWEF